MRIEEYATGGRFWFPPSSHVDIVIKFQDAAGCTPFAALDRVKELHQRGAFREPSSDGQPHRFEYTFPKEVVELWPSPDDWDEVFSDDAVSVVMRAPCS